MLKIPDTLELELHVSKTKARARQTHGESNNDNITSDAKYKNILFSLALSISFPFPSHSASPSLNFLSLLIYPPLPSYSLPVSLLPSSTHPPRSPSPHSSLLNNMQDTWANASPSLTYPKRFTASAKKETGTFFDGPAPLPAAVFPVSVLENGSRPRHPNKQCNSVQRWYHQRHLHHRANIGG